MRLLGLGAVTLAITSILPAQTLQQAQALSGTIQHRPRNVGSAEILSHVSATRPGTRQRRRGFPVLQESCLQARPR